MKFTEALEKINLNKHLIGKMYKGARVDELIIYPIEENELKYFKREYLLTEDAQRAIAPFINSDVSIAVVANKDWIIKEGVFTATDLDNLQNELEVK